MAKTRSYQNHGGRDYAETDRKNIAKKSQQSTTSRGSNSVKQGSSKSKTLATKAGTRSETQVTAQRQTTQTKEAATARTTRTTPETESVTTTYGHVGVAFTLSIKIQLGGQPSMVTIPPTD